jgi:hypothetical protein
MIDAVADVAAIDRHGVVDGDGRQRGRHLAAVGRGVEFVDGPRSADAARHAVPVTLAADAVRRHHTDAGDGDAWPHRRSPDHHGVSIIRGQSETLACWPQP